MKISTHIKDGKATLTRGTANEKDVAQKRHASSYPSSSASVGVSPQLSSYPSSSASVGVSSQLSSPTSSSASVGVSTQYRAPIKHNMHRRKTGHDYSRPGAYLITVETTDRQRLFGTLQGDSPNTAQIAPTTLGETVIAEFRAIERKVQESAGCQVQVLQYQLMPDHFHGILYIREQLPQGWHLGKIIGAWKGACSRAYWEASPSSASSSVSSPLSSPPSSSASVGVSSQLSSPPPSSASVGVSTQERSPLFSAGYNDRPLTAPGQLQGWISYLRDNPRRLWLKHHYPDRLRKVYNFTIGDSQTRYTAVGNTFLLKYPERQQVRCHRNLTEEQIHNEVNHYLHIARTGVVLVSPFISPAEKAVFEACYKEQLPMVRLVKRALDGKFVYPQGRDFDACAQGFLVVLAPFATGSENAADLRISRTQCLTLNDCAAELASSVSRRISDEYNGYVPQQISP